MTEITTMLVLLLSETQPTKDSRKSITKEESYRHWQESHVPSAPLGKKRTVESIWRNITVRPRLWKCIGNRHISLIEFKVFSRKPVLLQSKPLILPHSLGIGV